MLKKLTITALIILGFGNSYAQTVVGTWYGILKLPATSVHLVFHITKAGETYASTMDSPDQGANGLAADQTTFEANSLTVDFGKYNIKYNGIFKPDSNVITGTFIQGPYKFPLKLSANPVTDTTRKLSRPQDPKDFPYKQEDLTFTNPKGGDQLAGTLTLPANGKASRIVILITGSGPQNRNEELLNHRPFLVWSDWLTRNGIAVLRYDDRGVAQSTGNFQAATTADFAGDAEAAINYIKSRSDLKGISIGLMGHSEGGIIAPMIARYNKAVKFVVMLAGPGVPIIQLMEKQSADQMRLSGTPDNIIKLNSATNAKLYAAAITYKQLPDTAYKAKLDTILYNEYRNYPPGLIDNSKLNDIVNRTVAKISGPWFRYFLTIDPADYLTKVTCPVLALNGTLDMQVNCEANLAGIKKDLDAAGNKHHQEVALPDLNHLLQKAKTGAVSEYGQIDETVDPIALQKVTVWINQLP